MVNDQLSEQLAKNLAQNQKWFEFIDSFNIDARESGCYQGATFELTACCTLKCPMCYVRIDKSQEKALGGRPRTASEWIDMARQFRDQGGIFLLITGGEAMMRPDFPEIYEEISKMGLMVTLFTNGTTIDDKMLELLTRRPPSMVGITIYGASEETYQKFGGSPGSFQRAIDGLDRLLTIPNLMLDVKFTMCKENYRDFRQVYEIAAARNKFINWDFGSCAPVRGACSDARKLRLSKEELQEVQAVAEDISKPIWDKYKELMKKEPTEQESAHKDNSKIPSREYFCKGGKNSVYIAWDGRMYPCDMAAYPSAFPFEQGFSEAAADIRYQVDTLRLPKKCMSCAQRETICSCVPKAYNEMKDCARQGEKCNYTPIEKMEEKSDEICV